MSENKSLGHNSKKDFLKNPVEHIDITSFDSRKIISSMEKIIVGVSTASEKLAVMVILWTFDLS